MLSLKINGNKSVVINIKDSLHGGATHCVGTYNGPCQIDVICFGSFRMKPSDVMIKYMKAVCKSVIYNFI